MDYSFDNDDDTEQQGQADNSNAPPPPAASNPRPSSYNYPPFMTQGLPVDPSMYANNPSNDPYSNSAAVGFAAFFPAAAAAAAAGAQGSAGPAIRASPASGAVPGPSSGNLQIFNTQAGNPPGFQTFNPQGFNAQASNPQTINPQNLQNPNIQAGNAQAGANQTIPNIRTSGVRKRKAPAGGQNNNATGDGGIPSTKTLTKRQRVALGPTRTGPCDFCANHPVGQQMYAQNRVCDYAEIQGNGKLVNMIQCQNCADYRSQNPGIEHECVHTGMAYNCTRYGANDPRTYPNSPACTHCIDGNKASTCDVDPTLGYTCSACARRTLKCTLDGDDSLPLRRPAKLHPHRPWFRHMCDRCFQINQKAINAQQFQVCSWLSDSSEWQRGQPCANCVNDGTACIDMSHLVAHSRPPPLPQDWTLPTTFELRPTEIIDIDSSTQWRQTCIPCAKGSVGKCLVRWDRSKHACERCSQFGIACTTIVPTASVTNTNATTNSKITWPIYDLSKVGFGQYMPFVACTNCRNKNRNCDRQRPCDECTADGAPKACDPYKANLKHNTIPRGTGEFSGPMYYLAMGYGARGVNAVKTGALKEDWIGPFAALYGVADYPLDHMPLYRRIVDEHRNFRPPASAKPPYGIPEMGSVSLMSRVNVNHFSQAELAELIQSLWPNAHHPGSTQAFTTVWGRLRAYQQQQYQQNPAQAGRDGNPALSNLPQGQPGINPFTANPLSQPAQIPPNSLTQVQGNPPQAQANIPAQHQQTPAQPQPTPWAQPQPPIWAQPQPPIWAQPTVFPSAQQAGPGAQGEFDQQFQHLINANAVADPTLAADGADGAAVGSEDINHPHLPVILDPNHPYGDDPYGLLEQRWERERSMRPRWINSTSAKIYRPRVRRLTLGRAPTRQVPQDLDPAKGAFNPFLGFDLAQGEKPRFIKRQQSSRWKAYNPLENVDMRHWHYAHDRPKENKTRPRLFGTVDGQKIPVPSHDILQDVPHKDPPLEEVNNADDCCVEPKEGGYGYCGRQDGITIDCLSRAHLNKAPYRFPICGPCSVFGSKDMLRPDSNPITRTELMGLRAYLCNDCAGHFSSSTRNAVQYHAAGARRIYGGFADDPTLKGTYNIDDNDTEHTIEFQPDAKAGTGCSCANKILGVWLCRFHRLYYGEETLKHATLMREWRLSRFKKPVCPACLAHKPLSEANLSADHSGFKAGGPTAWACLTCNDWVTNQENDENNKPQMVAGVLEDWRRIHEVVEPPSEADDVKMGGI
ncbi:hypothetical protein FALBO_3491 [Fusarium albosuccineum]|uniref:Zn(2)-C6 fungal-type domain-containing protein n=1 Tax=Fusarium albosuccineum TaxID=1237068 RepID=A0A8H4LKN9_9HYPO|nr:hypothetical protein FALBO_3491 [Fusarium albosuccineum]